MSGASNGLPSCCNCRSSCQQVWSFLWPWPRQKRLPGLPAIKPPKWLGGSHLVAIFFGVPGCNSSLQMGIRVWSPTQINQPGALIIWKLCRLCKLNTEHPSPSCSLVPVTTVAVATTTCTKMTKQQLLSRSFILQLFRCKAQKKLVGRWPLVLIQPAVALQWRHHPCRIVTGMAAWPSHRWAILLVRLTVKAPHLTHTYVYIYIYINFLNPSFHGDFFFGVLKNSVKDAGTPRLRRPRPEMHPKCDWIVEQENIHRNTIRDKDQIHN